MKELKFEAYKMPQVVHWTQPILSPYECRKCGWFGLFGHLIAGDRYYTFNGEIGTKMFCPKCDGFIITAVFEEIN